MIALVALGLVVFPAACWLQDPHRRQRRAARRRLADDQARRRLRTRPPS